MGDKCNLMHMYSNLLYVQVLNSQICIILPVLIKSPSLCGFPHTTTKADLKINIVKTLNLSSMSNIVKFKGREPEASSPKLKCLTVNFT